MNCNEEQEVIDLGAASIETKGPGGQFVDTLLRAILPGLTDE
jgi:hypothetical protein